MTRKDQRHSARLDASGGDRTANASANSPGGHHIVADQSEVLAFLSRRQTYGISAEPIRIDTHAAIVFLTGTFAYKMKRAVRFPFLDFSTLERRRIICETEIERNRRNAPKIYIDTIPVTRRDGELELGGDGTVVEWLVRMHQFDPSDTLDHLAERGEFSEALVANLVDAIADSHDNAPVGDGAEATQRLGEWMRGNIDELREAPHVIANDRVQRLGRHLESEYGHCTDLLLARGRAGYVRWCHGDLHLRNIVLIDRRPVLFDALEFDEAFATHDILYDLAFLLMDLWQRGLHGTANRVLNRYLWRSGDIENIGGCALLPLFMSIRAAIRAKIAISTAIIGDGQNARADFAEAQHDFNFAEKFLTPVRPRLVAIGGLSGTGKTSIAGMLAAEVGRAPGAIHLRSDVERKRLFDVADTDRLPASAYAQDANEAVYTRVREKARRALGAGYSVIVDAAHNRPAERMAIEAAANECDTQFVGVWLDAPDDVLLKRIASRSGDASDADAEVVKLQRSYGTGHILWHCVDASRSAHSVARQVLKIVEAF